MNDVADSKATEHQPLSIDEVATAVNRLGQETLHLPAPTVEHSPAVELGKLPVMTTTQRFWLAFTGKPGSSGRAGPAYEPGLPRDPPPHPVDDNPLAIPRQRKPNE